MTTKYFLRKWLASGMLGDGDGTAVKDGTYPPLPEIKKENRHSHGSWSSSYISDDDWNQQRTSDILDLEKMATYMAEKKKELVSKLISVHGNVKESKGSLNISEAEMKKYTRLSDARFEKISQTDKYLKQAYELYFTPGLQNYPEVQRKTEAVIDRLEAQPHFYCPWDREESDEVHVSRWLNKYTSNPEPEMFGFPSGDQFEPRKIVVSAEPRLSTSDTNIVLGKRKRIRDEENEQYGHCVAKCSSETRLICDTGQRSSDEHCHEYDDFYCADIFFIIDGFHFKSTESKYFEVKTEKENFILFYFNMSNN